MLRTMKQLSCVVLLCIILCWCASYQACVVGNNVFCPTPTLQFVAEISPIDFSEDVYHELGETRGGQFIRVLEVTNGMSLEFGTCRTDLDVYGGVAPFDTVIEVRDPSGNVVRSNDDCTDCAGGAGTQILSNVQFTTTNHYNYLDVYVYVKNNCAGKASHGKEVKFYFKYNDDAEICTFYFYPEDDDVDVNVGTSINIDDLLDDAPFCNPNAIIVFEPISEEDYYEYYYYDDDNGYTGLDEISLPYTITCDYLGEQYFALYNTITDEFIWTRLYINDVFVDYSLPGLIKSSFLDLEYNKGLGCSPTVDTCVFNNPNLLEFCLSSAIVRSFCFQTAIPIGVMIVDDREGLTYLNVNPDLVKIGESFNCELEENGYIPVDLENTFSGIYTILPQGGSEFRMGEEMEIEINYFVSEDSFDASLSIVGIYTYIGSFLGDVYDGPDLVNPEDPTFADRSNGDLYTILENSSFYNIDNLFQPNVNTDSLFSYTITETITPEFYQPGNFFLWHAVMFTDGTDYYYRLSANQVSIKFRFP